MTRCSDNVIEYRRIIAALSLPPSFSLRRVRAQAIMSTRDGQSVNTCDMARAVAVEEAAKMKGLTRGMATLDDAKRMCAALSESAFLSGVEKHFFRLVRPVLGCGAATTPTHAPHPRLSAG